MAIAFNLPSDEATEENYARLNRLLAELYEVLCHILVSSSRQPPPSAEGERSENGSSSANLPRPEPRPRGECRNIEANTLYSLPGHLHRLTNIKGASSHDEADGSINLGYLMKLVRVIDFIKLLLTSTLTILLFYHKAIPKL